MFTDLKKRIVVFVLVVLAALLFLAPTALKEHFRGVAWISRPISLGLDLSGGVHLVYEVQAREAVKSRLQGTGNSLRSVLREQKVPVARATLNDRGQLEFTLMSDRMEQRAKDIIAENNREISFQGRELEGERVKLQFGFSEPQAAKIEEEAVTQAIETLRNRVDQFGVAEPVIQKVGTRRILLQMPGVSDIDSVKKVVGSVAKLEFRLVPTSSAISGVTIKDRSGSPVRVEDQALMSGDAVADARVSIMETGVEVALTLTGEGSRTFGRITSDNVGRQLSIILDGVQYSAPVIREAIRGGHASISGGFTMQEARQLAVVLRAGALPAPLAVMEERTVGPSLGAESIRKGVVSILIGFALIVVFMACYYRKSGVVAVFSLALNLVLLLACLSAFGATLTLPGLAGLALTVGMAVDSNVIIFERIRDELRNGSSRDAAVRGGFDKALSAIMDSNLTTLLSAALLYWFGTGPVRGFAVTLAVGIVTTVFCATFVSRLAFDSLQLKGKQGLSI